jgi:hypothetical protein
MPESLFLPVADYYFIVWMHNNWFIHLPIERLQLLQFLAIMTEVVKTFLCRFLWKHVFNFFGDILCSAITRR